MPLNLTTMTSMVGNILGAYAASTYGGAVTDKRWTATAITDAIHAAAMEVANVIVNTDNHPLKATFYAPSSNLASGSELPASDGPYGAVLVDGLVPRPVPPAEVARLVSNVLGLNVGKVYAIFGIRIFHNGTVATVEIATIDSTTDLNLPESLTWAVVAGALALLFAKDAADTETASYFAAQYNRRIDLIKMGAASVPPIEASQEVAGGN
jgi:hypothetical protein